MIVTNNLKARVKELKAKEGYTHVSSICSNQYTTDYFHYVSIDEILAAENGESLSYGRYNGITQTMFYANNPNASVIRYQNVFI